MQNDQSDNRGASGQRGKRKKQGGDVLSPQLQRGDTFRRVVVAAATLRGIYTDDGLADAAGVSRGTVRGWWLGALPKAETMPGLARATGLDRQEVIDWVHYGGLPPRLPQPVEVEALIRAASAERSRLAPPGDAESEERPAPPSTTESR